MGGDAQADSTKRDASGSHSGARNCRRGRPVRHHPVGGTVARDGSPNGGLIVASSGLAIIHRNVIVTLAARHKLPAVYFERFFVAAGGLISYGTDTIDQFRRAAGYADRILMGEKPADLPVQAPTKYELAINLKTAKALGLDVASTLLATADQVIE